MGKCKCLNGQNVNKIGRSESYELNSLSLRNEAYSIPGYCIKLRLSFYIKVDSRRFIDALFNGEGHGNEDNVII